MITKVKQRLIRFAQERVVGRAFLAIYITACARRYGLNASVYFDQVWLHRIDGCVYADDFNYSYNRASIRQWANQSRDIKQTARDCWFYQYTPKHGDVVVDAGAGAGEEIPLFSKLAGPNGRVLAIEAHPKTFIRLERMCHHNHLDNVILEGKAAMDKPGTIQIEDDNADGSIGSTITECNLPRKNTYTVEGTTIDRLVMAHHLLRVDFVKMNIEGAERFALLGMQKTLVSAKAVAIAAHDFRTRANTDWFKTRSFVKEFLLARGFQIIMREDDPRPWIRDVVYGLRA